MPNASAGVALRSLVVLAVACTFGCSRDEGGGRVPEARGPALVLQDEDLRGPWTPFDVGPQGIADAPPARPDPARFGRLGGWKARFRRPGSAATRGPLVVESRADVFADAEGAEQEFDAASDELERLAKAPGDPPRLGDETRAAATGGTGAGEFRSFTLLWREANVTASVTANGFGDRISLDDVVTLARKQQARIEAARAG